MDERQRAKHLERARAAKGRWDEVEHRVRRGAWRNEPYQVMPDRPEQPLLDRLTAAGGGRRTA
jgi:hypothetical protein